MRNETTFWNYPLAIMGLSLLLLISCKKSDSTKDPTPSSTTVTDVDGNVYHTVQIGSQTWMLENLKTTKYRNGDPIPTVTDDAIWKTLTTGAHCNYNNDAATASKYGKIYNWYAVNDSRNIAPTGWHVASDLEWSTLESFAAANLGTSGSVPKILATKTDWASSTSAGAIGNDLTKNNSSGFSGLPGGSRFGLDGSYYAVGNLGTWWSSSVYDAINGWGRGLYYDYNTVDRSYIGKKTGCSVRCIKD